MLKRLVALGISLGLLALLLASVDRGELLRVLRGIHWGWFGVGLLLFVPQIACIAHRWVRIAQPVAAISHGEATRQVLASSTLNLVLPSKLGDLAKGVFLHRQGRCSMGQGLQVVVFEKLLDLASLSAWMVVGWLLAPRAEAWILGVLLLGFVIVIAVHAMYFTEGGSKRLAALIPGIVARTKFGGKIVTMVRSAPDVVRLVDREHRRRGILVGWSFLIWLLHLVQIHCFLMAVGAVVPLFEVLARMPVALLAGLLPISIAGVGVRDWAIVAIFGATAGISPEPLVAAGLLVSLRYVVPALGGMPFVGRYLTMARERD